MQIISFFYKKSFFKRLVLVGLLVWMRTTRGENVRGRVLGDKEGKPFNIETLFFMSL